MSELQPRPFRVLLASLCAILLLPSCGSSTNAARGPNSFNSGEWRVTIRNQTDRYVWISRLWTTKYTGWHNEGSNCIAPHDETTQAIYFTTDFFSPQAKIRVEVKPDTAGRTNCAGDANSADFSGTPCFFDFANISVFRGLVTIYGATNDWKANTVCHS